MGCGVKWSLLTPLMPFAELARPGFLVCEKGCDMALGKVRIMAVTCSVQFVVY